MRRQVPGGAGINGAGRPYRHRRERGGWCPVAGDRGRHRRGGHIGSFHCHGWRGLRDSADNAIRQLSGDEPLSSSAAAKDLLDASLYGGATAGLLGKLGEMSAAQSCPSC